MPGGEKALKSWREGCPQTPCPYARTAPGDFWLAFVLYQSEHYLSLTAAESKKTCLARGFPFWLPEEYLHFPPPKHVFNSWADLFCSLAAEQLQGCPFVISQGDCLWTASYYFLAVFTHEGRQSQSARKSVPVGCTDCLFTALSNSFC